MAARASQSVVCPQVSAGELGGTRSRLALEGVTLFRWGASAGQAGNQDSGLSRGRAPGGDQDVSAAGMWESRKLSRKLFACV